VWGVLRDYKLVAGKALTADVDATTTWAGRGLQDRCATTLTGAIYHVNVKNVAAGKDADPTMYVARYRYALSKRTDLHVTAAYAKAKNGQLTGLSRDDAGYGTSQHGLAWACGTASCGAIARWRRLLKTFGTVLLHTDRCWLLGPGSVAAQAAGAECIVPSKPGGAMDLTCKLARKACTPAGTPKRRRPICTSPICRAGSARWRGTRWCRSGAPSRIRWWRFPAARC
jgi:hypothetical protein